MPSLPPGRNSVFDIHFTGDAAPGVNPWSARGLKGTLSPIDAAKGSDKLRRTINGTLIDISAPQMRKYQLEINGDDQAPPAFDGLWVGMEVVVDSNVELAYLTAGGAPAKPAVPGSERVEGDYTYYLMRLPMLISSYQVETDEWAAHYTWSLAAEEI